MGTSSTPPRGEGYIIERFAQPIYERNEEGVTNWANLKYQPLPTPVYLKATSGFSENINEAQWHPAHMPPIFNPRCERLVPLPREKGQAHGL